MRILFVNACPRKSASRTLALAQQFLGDFTALVPDSKIITHDLSTMRLQPIEEETLAIREKLCDARNWQHPLTTSAAEFVTADCVVVAAPYWDLSFPSMLKVWMEHMWIRNLSFYYENDKPIGLCQAKEAVYLTTAGSYLQGHDWGTAYIQDCLTTLGVRHFSAIRAEALDLAESNSTRILEKAAANARELAAIVARSYRKS